VKNGAIIKLAKDNGEGGKHRINIVFLGEERKRTHVAISQKRIYFSFPLAGKGEKKESLSAEAPK